MFLDLMMPGMDGWRFMSELRVRPTRRSIPIVVVSGFGTPEGVRSLGAADYLRKPFRMTRVVEIVRALCFGRAALRRDRLSWSVETRGLATVSRSAFGRCRRLVRGLRFRILPSGARCRGATSRGAALCASALRVPQ